MGEWTAWAIALRAQFRRRLGLDQRLQAAGVRRFFTVDLPLRDDSAEAFIRLEQAHYPPIK